MKMKYFAVYVLIIVATLLSLPFAFGNWSQSVFISGYIKTAEIELEPKETPNADKSADNAEEKDTEADPESATSPETQQEAEDGSAPENPVENPSNQGGVSAEIENEGDEIPTGAEAVPADSKPTESEPDTSSVKEEEKKNDFSQDQKDQYREYESEAKTSPGISKPVE